MTKRKRRSTSSRPSLSATTTYGDFEVNETGQQAHPYPRSVEAIEETLKLAQAGRVAAFAILTVDPGGVVKWGWHLGSRLPTDLIGGIACMQQVIIAHAMTPPPAPQPQPEPPTEEWERNATRQ